MIALDDLDRIMAVMNVAFDPAYGEAWSRRQVADALLVGNCHQVLVAASGAPARAGERAAGFLLSRHVLGEEELLLLAVDPVYRRRGLAAAMIATLVAAARHRGASRVLLEMRRGNPAEALYRAAGFAPIGRRPNYYRTVAGDPLDAVTFQLCIR